MSMRETILRHAEQLQQMAQLVLRYREEITSRNDPRIKIVNELEEILKRPLDRICKTCHRFHDEAYPCFDSMSEEDSCPDHETSEEFLTKLPTTEVTQDQTSGETPT